MSTLEGGAWQAAGGYLEHLSDADLALLGSAAGSLPAERLRGDPAIVERLLDDPRTFQAVFGGTGRADPLLRASPFLVFALLDVVPAGERVGIYRRLGDLALFLTGVFPDHTATRAFAPVHAQRLLRHAGLEGVEAGRPGSMAEPAWGSGGVALLERLGRRWYRLAYQSAPVRTAPLRVMDEVAERFDQARRILNLVTDTYLFPFRARWFPGPASGG